MSHSTTQRNDMHVNNPPCYNQYVCLFVHACQPHNMSCWVQQHTGTQPPQLRVVDLVAVNSLTEIDLSACGMLRSLRVTGAKKLQSIKLPACLLSLHLSELQVEALDIQHLDSLTSLYLYNLIGDGISSLLEELHDVTHLDVYRCSGLTTQDLCRLTDTLQSLVYINVMWSRGTDLGKQLEDMELGSDWLVNHGSNHSVWKICRDQGHTC
jgi:hypothetical protein